MGNSIERNLKNTAPKDGGRTPSTGIGNREEEANLLGTVCPGDQEAQVGRTETRTADNIGEEGSLFRTHLERRPRLPRLERRWTRQFR